MKQLFCTLFLVASFLYKADNIYAQKCAGHPLFSNMANHEVASCTSKEFEKASFTIRDKAKGTSTRVEKTGELLEVSFSWKGEWDKRPSPLQIYQNYDNAIKQAGGQVFYRQDDTNGGVQGKLTKGGDTWWIKVNTDGSGYYYLTSIKEAAMRQDVVVTADEIKKGLNEDGKMAFYGIYFDTDKATIKPESAETLKEMASYLKANPTQKVFIVGHTDNTGDFQHNLTLSKQRAAAVVNELVSKYAVPATQVTADGVGSLSPVATNKSDDGKARNRRVEMVQK